MGCSGSRTVEGVIPESKQVVVENDGDRKSTAGTAASVDHPSTAVSKPPRVAEANENGVIEMAEEAPDVEIESPDQLYSEPKTSSKNEKRRKKNPEQDPNQTTIGEPTEVVQIRKEEQEKEAPNVHEWEQPALAMYVDDGAVEFSSEGAELAEDEEEIMEEEDARPYHPQREGDDRGERENSMSSEGDGAERRNTDEMIEKALAEADQLLAEDSDLDEQDLDEPVAEPDFDVHKFRQANARQPLPPPPPPEPQPIGQYDDEYGYDGRDYYEKNPQHDTVALQYGSGEPMYDEPPQPYYNEPDDDDELQSSKILDDDDEALMAAILQEDADDI